MIVGIEGLIIYIFAPYLNHMRSTFFLFEEEFAFKGAYWISSNCEFFQYSDSIIGLFSIAPPLVIALQTLR